MDQTVQQNVQTVQTRYVIQTMEHVGEAVTMDGKETNVI